MTQLIDYEEIKAIKKLTIIALCSDEYLMDKLVLKGGTSLELIFKVINRMSKDIDFSVDGALVEYSLEELRKRIEQKFISFFIQYDYYPIDVKFIERPKEAPIDHVMSGYKLTFKLLREQDYHKWKTDVYRQRMAALPLGPEGKKDFTVEISKFEYCNLKERKYLDGHSIFVYSPALIVFEKLRAICQKMKEYSGNPGDKDEARYRDFFDIERVNENLAKIDFKNNENRQILKQVFMAKDVPLALLSKIKDKVHVHLADAPSVKSTEAAKSIKENYQYFIDYVLDIVDQLDEFWME